MFTFVCRIWRVNFFLCCPAGLHYIETDGLNNFFITSLNHATIMSYQMRMLSTFESSRAHSDELQKIWRCAPHEAILCHYTYVLQLLQSPYKSSMYVNTQSFYKSEIRDFLSSDTTHTRSRKTIIVKIFFRESKMILIEQVDHNPAFEVDAEALALQKRASIVSGMRRLDLIQ